MLTALPLRINGRVEPIQLNLAIGQQGYRSQWPGVSFETAFAGPEVYLAIGQNHEILHVQLDGEQSFLLENPEIGVYKVSGLEKRHHTIRVLVATESKESPNDFGGFGVVPGAEDVALKDRPRQIEFIGDSHTVGYGNTSAKRDCTAKEVWVTTDNTKAFGPLIAEYFQADYQINAISGRGVVRNNNGSAGDTLPAAYPYVLFDKKQRYAALDWKPQIIVIALGTNDFSTQLHPSEKWKSREELYSDYEANYLRFIENLRKRNHDAYIILWATDLVHGEIASEEKRVVEKAEARGETRIAFLPIEHLSFAGCHGHPSLVDDKMIQERLVQFIDSRSGIW